MPGLPLLIAPHISLALVLVETQLASLGQLKPKHRFLKVWWAERAPQGPGEGAGGGGWVGAGRQQNKGWCKGSLAAQPLGCAPKNVYSWGHCQSVWQQHWGAHPLLWMERDTSLQKDFIFLCFLWLWFNHGLWCFKYQILIRSGKECVPKGPYCWSSHHS